MTCANHCNFQSWASYVVCDVDLQVSLQQQLDAVQVVPVRGPEQRVKSVLYKPEAR